MTSPRAGASGVSPCKGRSGAEEARQRLDTPLAEASPPASAEPSDGHRPRTAGQRFDTSYSDNGGAGGAASRLISSFSSLPGLK